MYFVCLCSFKCTFPYKFLTNKVLSKHELFYKTISRLNIIMTMFSILLTCPSVQFSSVQSLNRVQLFATPWTAASQFSLSITNSWSLLKFMSRESIMPSKHLILYHPLLLLHSIFLSIRVFSNELALPISWPKYWSFSFSISPSNEYSGLISFRMEWLDLLAVQGTLKSHLQHHSLKAQILWHSAFFMIQVTSIHDYWKNDRFDCKDLCQKSDSLLFDMLSRFVIAFLPRSECLLISWQQSLSAVILERGSKVLGFGV